MRVALFLVKDVSLSVCKDIRFFIKHLHYYSCFSQYCNKWHITDVLSFRLDIFRHTAFSSLEQAYLQV